MGLEKVKLLLSEKYEFIRLIGKGGFAEVYLAKDKLLEREVAIKILLSEHSDDKEIVERFIREAKLYAKFDHKNLIPIYETGIIEKNAFLVMKYVNGLSLKDIIEKRGSLDSELTLKVVKGMVSALSYIHSKGIIHRDIKPANILIEEGTNRVYLADFGIARPISSKTLTQTGMLIGTPYYISPEQIKKGVADRRSDIYALGTTLYEIIAGRPVFKSETPIEVLYKHVNEEPKPIASINPNITVELKHIVEKCLQKDPKDRFQNANEILDFIDTGKTRKIKKKRTKANSSSFMKKFLLIFLIPLVVISGIVFGLYKYTTVFDFLKQNVQIEEKKEKNTSISKKDEDLRTNQSLTENENKNDIESKEIKTDNIGNIGEKKANDIPPVDNNAKKEDNEIINKPALINDNKTKIKDELIQDKNIVKETPKDRNYNKYFNLAKFYYSKADYVKASKNLKKAKGYKKTLELYQLDESINDKLNVLKQKQLEKKQLPIKRNIQKISLFKLKPLLAKSYLNKLKLVKIIVNEKKKFFINRVKINGQLTVKLRIDEYGRLTIKEINDENLIIYPLLTRKKIIRSIWLKLKSIKLSPPVDKNDKKSILETWRITFNVLKFSNKIILRKV